LAGLPQENVIQADLLIDANRDALLSRLQPRTIFNCVDACPRGINITAAILEVSNAVVERPS